MAPSIPKLKHLGHEKGLIGKTLVTPRQNLPYSKLCDIVLESYNQVLRQVE